MTMMIAPALPLVNPSPAPSDPFHVRESWWLGFSHGVDGKPAAVPRGYPADLTASYLDGHWSGSDNRETAERTAAAEALALEELAELAIEPADHTAADEQAWLGWTLGSDGIDAEPAGVLTAAQRDAFVRGHHDGEDHLYTVDPLWAEHLRELAERSRFAAYDEDHRHEMATRDHFEEIERNNAEEFNRRRRPVAACPSMVD